MGGLQKLRTALGRLQKWRTVWVDLIQGGSIGVEFARMGFDTYKGGLRIKLIMYLIYV